MQLLVILFRVVKIAMRVISISSPIRLFTIFYLFNVGSCWEIWGYNVELSVPKQVLKFVSNPYCLKYECCNENWIQFKKRKLINNFSTQVFGQPLLNTAVDALSAHFNPHFKPSKALTLSFHGMTGTGKNYVSRFIAESIFTNGMKSKYVHHFFARIHFAETSLLKQYQTDLYSWIKGNISQCATQLFIFDEVDKMIPNLLDYITPQIDYLDDVEGVDYSKAVFLFLSNIGADVITEHYHDLYVQEGKNREDLMLSDFEYFIQKGAFNENGGLFHGRAISNNLIDHYIPFLPLEKKHIQMCIKKEFEVRKVLNPDEEHINEVMKFIEWGPDSSKLFSKTGCKRLGPKVATLVDRHYRHVAFIENDEL